MVTYSDLFQYAILIVYGIWNQGLMSGLYAKKIATKRLPAISVRCIIELEL